MKKDPRPVPPAVERGRRLLVMAGLTVIFISVFRLLKTSDLYLLAVALYTAAALGVAVYYIIYNKGVLSGTVTPQMLPSDWSAEKRQDFINDLATRRKRSKWALMVLIPLIFVFGFELLELYFFPMLSELFSGGTT